MDAFGVWKEEMEIQMEIQIKFQLSAKKHRKPEGKNKNT